MSIEKTPVGVADMPGMACFLSDEEPQNTVFSTCNAAAHNT